MALPYAYDAAKQVSPYSQDAMKRRLNKVPQANRFTAGGMQPLGGEQNLNTTLGTPQSMQPAQQPTSAPQPAPNFQQISGSTTTPPPAPNYLEQQRAYAATTTTPTGGVQAKGKTPKPAEKPKSNSKTDSKKKKNERPWYLQGYNKKTDPGKKIRSFLSTDPSFQQQVLDFEAAENENRGIFQNKRSLINQTHDREIELAKYDRQANDSRLIENMAASGLIRSTPYLTEKQQVEKDFNNQKLKVIEEALYGKQDVASEKTNFLRQLKIMQQQARADALQRKAAKEFSFGGLA
jgi:hypothetical protein